MDSRLAPVAEDMDTAGAETLAAWLEQQVPGFKACFGGEELNRAAAALGSVIGTRRQRELQSKADAEDEALAAAPASPLSALLTSTPQEGAEGDLQLRELALAANLYNSGEACAHHQDHETLYNHGLVLQELAAKLLQSPATQLELLRQAADKYEASLRLKPSAHAAMYNWGVALSDIARLQKDTDPEAALRCLQQAAMRYAEALDLQPGNPQALNNWGLVLQELSGHGQSPPERDALVFYALEKFRHAVRLRPDFDRGCYNLGTVLYTYACAVQAELANQLKAGRLTALDPETTRERNAREARVRGLFSTAAQYICLAYALQQGKDIYKRSLAVVKPMLPLPFLRAGYLTVPVRRTLGGPAEVWRREWFVLDHESLRSASALESSLSNPATTASGLVAGPQLKIGHAVDEEPLEVALADMACVRRCCDPSLPEGDAFWVHLARPLPGAAVVGGGGAPTIYFVADDADAADAWVDALLLSYHVAGSRSQAVLAEALTPSSPAPVPVGSPSGGGAQHQAAGGQGRPR